MSVNPGNGRASLEATNLAMEDYFNLANALADGPSLEGVVSFRADWTASSDRHQLGSAESGFEMTAVFNSATASWTGETEAARYVSDPASTSFSVFAEVGHERNGVFA